MATNYTEHYHDWLRDAHAMEKQAESMLEKMADRLEHYPDLRARIVQHIEETRQQQKLVDQVLARNNISTSTLKDAMGKLSAMGQALGGMMTPDEVVSMVTYIACYTSLISAAEMAGDHEGAAVFKQIREQEIAMADWCQTHLPDVTQQFLSRSAQPHTEAKR